MPGCPFSQPPGSLPATARAPAAPETRRRRALSPVQLLPSKVCNSRLQEEILFCSCSPSRPPAFLHHLRRLWDCSVPQGSHWGSRPVAYIWLGVRFIPNKRVPPLPSFSPRQNPRYKKNLKQKQLSPSPLITPITSVRVTVLTEDGNSQHVGRRSPASRCVRLENGSNA